MKLFIKILSIAVVFAALCLLIFALWGDVFESLFSHEKCVQWLADIKSIGWLVGILLLISDILLPVPATGIMSALGDVYGFWLGWGFGAFGSVSAGLLGYGLVRMGRERLANRLASPRDLRRFQSFFDHWGGAAIIVSRLFPILPEVMSVLAGLAKMRFLYFLSALLLGTLPVTALFSWWGNFATAKIPVTAHVIAIIAPVLIWPLFLLLLRRR